MHLRRAIRHDRRGATSIEYALIASLIAMAIIASLQSTGSKFGVSLNKVSNKL